MHKLLNIDTIDSFAFLKIDKSQSIFREKEMNSRVCVFLLYMRHEFPVTTEVIQRCLVNFGLTSIDQVKVRLSPRIVDTFCFNHQRPHTISRCPNIHVYRMTPYSYLK